MFSKLIGSMHSETVAGLSADYRFIGRASIRGCHQIAQGIHRIRPETDSSLPILASSRGQA